MTRSFTPFLLLNLMKTAGKHLFQYSEVARVCFLIQVLVVSNTVQMQTEQHTKHFSRSVTVSTVMHNDDKQP